MKEYLEFKNFNGVGFKVSDQYYIFTNYNNHIFKTDFTVFSIIDDSFTLRKNEILKKYRQLFNKSKITEGLKNIEKMKKNGILNNFRINRFSVDSYDSNLNFVKQVLGEKLSLLVLNVTESCNLRCKYCIYSGSYQNRRNHNNLNEMPISIAKKAVDFLQSPA